MEPKVKMTPKDFFLNLGIVVTLYTSAITFLTLLFEIINRVFPDALSYGYYNSGYYSGSIRFAIASLVIMFPLCVLLSALNNREAVAVPEKKKLSIRRWLSYVTLFLTSLAMAIDLITLINTFLGGEITIRFALKILAVFGVSAVIFAYYIYDLRTETPGGKGPRIFAGAVTVLILAGIIGGFFIIGSPLTQRLRVFDERRIGDLQTIQSQVVYFWQRKGVLPKSLMELNDPLSGYIVPVDPKTSQVYEYIFNVGTSFKVCATFDLSSDQLPNGIQGRNASYYREAVPEMYKGDLNNNWSHSVGRTCFDRTIDKMLYPPAKPIPPLQ